MPRRGPRDRCRQSGKAKFTTWDSAAAHAHRLDGNDAYAYYCKSCGRRPAIWPHLETQSHLRPLEVNMSPIRSPLPSRKGVAQVMIWDWREQPDIGELAKIIYDLSGGRLYVSGPDTDCDEVAIVVSTVPLDPEASKDAFHRWWVSEDGGGDRLDEIEVTASA